MFNYHDLYRFDFPAGRLDTEVVPDYIRSMSPIAPCLDDRIIVYDSENPAPMICQPDPPPSGKRRKQRPVS